MWVGQTLRYRSIEEPNVLRRLGRLRSSYHDYGPNLTDVEYSGITSDGRISANIVQMGRTDDLVRTYYHLEYTFNEDVRYDRLAFFQMAADNYGDNGFASVAWGHGGEIVGRRDIPDHEATGYADAGDRGIPLVGDSPWVMLFDNRLIDARLPEHFADLAFVVRDFEARIGDEVIETPHLSLHRTFNRWSQYGLELDSPFVPEEVILPAVQFERPLSTLSPADKAVYYGESDWLRLLPPDEWRTPMMAQTFMQVTSEKLRLMLVMSVVFIQLR